MHTIGISETSKETPCLSIPGFQIVRELDALLFLLIQLCGGR